MPSSLSANSVRALEVNKPLSSLSKFRLPPTPFFESKVSRTICFLLPGEMPSLLSVQTDRLLGPTRPSRVRFGWEGRPLRQRILLPFTLFLSYQASIFILIYYSRTHHLLDAIHSIGWGIKYLLLDQIASQLGNSYNSQISDPWARPHVLTLDAD